MASTSKPIIPLQSTAIISSSVTATASGSTKTINIGTGGLSGSFTNINIGPGPSAGVGTVTINSGTNLGIGSLTPTSALDVSGDAKIAGVVTATSYNGSGSNLTGIVTYITAGSGISINQSTGNVTITATGGGGGTQDLNTTLGYGNVSSLGMSVGISTFTGGAGTVIVGGATTALVVNDSATITNTTTNMKKQ